MLDLSSKPLHVHDDSNNIGQIAYLNAQAHGLKRIYFGGCFIRGTRIILQPLSGPSSLLRTRLSSELTVLLYYSTGHPITMNTLSYAINFWSKGTIKALFLRHEGYLGAVGAFMKHRTSRRNSRSFTVSEQLAQKLEKAALEVTLAQDTLDVVADEDDSS